MLEIDGSQKSGSGTIVRDVVPFSILMGKEVRLTNIRSRREKPGLRPQHLKALQACERLCHGKLGGGTVGSREIVFRPGKSISGGHFNWDIGTAGSATMLAFTVIPLALFADNASTHTITGGLFQDFAPSIYHLQQVLLSTLRTMGASIDVKILKPGYVPKGKGRIEVKVKPLKDSLRPINQTEQGEIRAINGAALSSHLKERNVSERMAKACKKQLSTQGFTSEIDIIYDEESKPAYEQVSVQPGAGFAIWATTSSGCLIGSDMAGALKRSAEFIGKQTARRLIEDISTDATVDRYLADQLIPYAALADGTTTYRIPRMTDHIESRIWLIEEILGAKSKIEKHRLTVEGIGFKNKI